LSETKALLAKLQASMLCGQVAAYAAHHRVCAACGVLQPLKDRRTRRLQTLFGTVEVEAPRFKVCRCRLTTPLAEVTISPVCALLTARCTPELERVQAGLGARTSFRDAARILDTLLPVSPANHESLRTRTHAVALQLEAAGRQQPRARLSETSRTRPQRRTRAGPSSCSRHRQLVGLRSRWCAIRTAWSWLRRSSDAGDLGPNLIGLGPGGSILGGWNVVAAELEEVVDPVVGGQEALRLAG